MSGNDVGQLGADVLPAHEAGGDRVMQVADGRALLEDVSDDGARGE